MMIILLDVHLVLPVGYCPIQQCHSQCEEWITEESKSKNKSHRLDDRMT
jgi:hypothetical protein